MYMRLQARKKRADLGGNLVEIDYFTVIRIFPKDKQLTFRINKAVFKSLQCKHESDQLELTRTDVVLLSCIWKN